jgi:tripartite-type tricarboxylate transporter receptor subunit TctC
MLQVPYKNPPQIVVDLLGGQLSFAFVDMATAGPLSASGKVRALAVLADNRFPLLPNVPTMKEVGIPDFKVVAWFGMFGPAGTSPAVVDRMNREINLVLAKPDFRERTAAVGLDVFGSTPEGMAVYLKEQIAMWGKLAAEAGLKPE